MQEALLNNKGNIKNNSLDSFEASDNLLNENVSQESSLSTTQTAAYAAPVFGSFFFYVPMFSILPGIYAKYFGLELTAIASTVLLIRLFDGITDPAIGYLADKHRCKGGSRKSWVVVGGLCTIFACYFLFTPPPQITVLYYLIWSFIYFLAFTIAEIPHATWGTELTTEYNQRAHIYSARNISLKLGILTFYILPLLPIYTSNEYTPEILEDAVYVGAFISVIGLSWTFFHAPSGYTEREYDEKKETIYSNIQAVIKNRPLTIYLIAYLCSGISLGMWFGLLYIYLDGFLSMGKYIAIMFAAGTLASAISTPFWLKLIKISSKHITWALGTSLFCIQLFGFTFIESSHDWWIPLLLIIIAYIAFACNNVSSLSALGDIVDFGKLKFHRDRGATYFALNSLMYKVGLGVGSGISLGVAGLFGFDPASTTQSESSIHGIELGFIYLPALFAAISVIFILMTPINRKRHRIIERWLARTASRL